MLRRCTIALIAAIVTACASHPRYTASFQEIDQNRDAVIEWWEFEAYYAGADPKTFLAADHDKDGEVTPVEWQFFTDTQP